MSQYAIKGGDKEEHVQLANTMATDIGREINTGVNTIAKRIPNLSKVTQAVVDVAYSMHSAGGVNLKDTAIDADGVWVATVAVNGNTRILHSKEDCMYTMIYVPRQCPKAKIGAYRFQLALGPSITLC